MTEEIELTLPRDRRFYDVVHLVVGGLAARLDLTVDNLADLQLALAGLLPRGEQAGDVTIRLRLAGSTLIGRVGPFEAEALRRELAREGGDGYGTHHVLETVFDSYRVDILDSDAWVEFALGVAPKEAIG